MHKRNIVVARDTGRRYKGVMTCKEIRLAMGLNQSKFAAVIGVNRATVCRWENGRVPVPRWADLLFKRLERDLKVEKVAAE